MSEVHIRNSVRYEKESDIPRALKCLTDWLLWMMGKKVGVFIDMKIEKVKEGKDRYLKLTAGFQV